MGEHNFLASRLGARLVMISILDGTLPGGPNISASMGTSIKVELRECRNPGRVCVVPDLQSDVAHIWTRPLEVPAQLQEACFELLSIEERERAARYRVPRPRTDFIVTRGTLRLLLAGYLGMAPQELSFRYSEHGKPLIDGPSDLRFNVSHTDGLALLGFVRTRAIGVDVEKITASPDARKLAERFFSVRERQFLEKLSGDDLHAAFFRCWTRKEAYVKARGEGLSLPLHEFDVSVAAGESHALLATRPDSSEAGRWTLRDLPVESGYAAALAVAEMIGDSQQPRW
jgi:4'-phosphopantetheinyl transferase